MPETFRLDEKAFGSLPDPDRIALLDDEWALASSGQAPLADYLALARSMGGDLDGRAWEQIAGALDMIEYRERGSAEHDAFIAFARSILAPVADRLGWDPQPGEAPDMQDLRREFWATSARGAILSVIAEAHKRFIAFVADRRAIRPDDQQTILDIVALNADTATFEQLHNIALAGKNETEKRRYYDVLMHVRDDALANRALDIALSAEIPPQSTTMRICSSERYPTNIRPLHGKR